MSIQRFETGPRMSQVVVHGNTVYLAGVVASNAATAAPYHLRIPSSPMDGGRLGGHRKAIKRRPSHQNLVRPRQRVEIGSRIDLQQGFDMPVANVVDPAVQP